MSTLDPISPSASEAPLWKGHSSQWTHFWYYLFCIILLAGCVAGIPFTAGLSAIGIVVPLVLWIIRWWLTKTTFYELTSQRLRLTTGILNRRVDDLELYRVKDYALDQPLMLRMLGLGNLSLITSDATTPAVAIKAVRGAEGLRELLRVTVQAERDRKRVRELDLGGGEEALPH